MDGSSSTEPADGSNPAAPDLSSEPISVTEHAVPVAQWDTWNRSALEADRTARRQSSVAGLATAIVSLVVGFVVFQGAWVATAAFYGPLAAWAITTWTRNAVRKRKLESTVAEVRQALNPAEISEFDSEVLIAMLTRPRVAAGRHNRFVTVQRAGEQIKIAVHEYDMTQVEPSSHPYGAGG
jgi:hypothetical protein